MHDPSRAARRLPAARVAPAVAAAAVAALILTGARAPFDPTNARDATTFPRAHGAHPGSALEWWYLTGVLRDTEGYRLGFQVTFFRARVGGREEAAAESRAAGARPTAMHPTAAAPVPRAASAWRPGDIYFAHYAISDLTARFHRFDERIARTSVALAGADSMDLRVWIRDWSLRRLGNGTFRVRATSSTLGDLELDLVPPARPPVAWGRQYLSIKNASGTSFSRYHSYPRMRVEGRVTAPGGVPRAVRGTAWYDHEWTNGVYDPELAGWDWFGLRLRDGRSIMLYRMRSSSEGTKHLFGGIVERDGIVRTFREGHVRMDVLRRWTSPRGARYPVGWLITIARPGEVPLELHVSAALTNQELDTQRSTRVAYWEGFVEGRAEEAERSQRLEGYMELTGYAGGGVPGRMRER